MLTYNHTFNEDIAYPFHIHQINSSTGEFKLFLNGLLKGSFKNTIGTKYQFTKKVNLGASIVELLVDGSRQVYSTKEEQLIFTPNNSIFISDGNNFLNMNPITKEYFWAPDTRTTFYFNPYYFNSRQLWIELIGYVPSNVPIQTILDYDAISQLIYKKVVTVDIAETWLGEKAMPSVSPIMPKVFDLPSTGVLVDLSVNYFLNDLQELSNGDTLVITNGIDTLTIEVQNVYTKAIFEPSVTTYRPIAYIPIKFINPNKKILITKYTPKGFLEIIKLNLHSNNIQFNLRRI